MIIEKDLFPIIDLFLNNKSYSINRIGIELNLTKRQVEYRINKLNTILKIKNAQEITLDQVNLSLISEDTFNMLKQLMDEVEATKNYDFSKRERSAFIYLMLFLKSEYISLNTFITLLQVSRSTVIGDMKALSTELEQRGIQIENNRSDGYFLTGKEIDCRSFMMRTVVFLLSNDEHTKVFDIIIKSYNLDSISETRQIIETLTPTYGIDFVENRLREFIYIFIYLRRRIENTDPQSFVLPEAAEVPEMSVMKEYAFSKDLLNSYEWSNEAISDSELRYVTAWILGISVGDYSEYSIDRTIIVDLVSQMLSRFEVLSGVRYENYDGIFNQLYSHFRAAYYRMIFRLPIYNPMTNKIYKEYHGMVELVKTTTKPLESIIGYSLMADELAYLTIHFASSIKQSNEVIKYERKKALILCAAGIGTSVILNNELSELFPEFEFIMIDYGADLESITQDADIIFVTNYNSRLQECNTPVIRVNAIMSSQEKYHLSREVYETIGTNSSDLPEMYEILDVISKYVDAETLSKISGSLSTYFNRSTHVHNKANDKLSLRDIISVDTIQVGLDAEDWQTAIRKAALPMVDQGIISNGYVEDIIKVTNETGPYMVISKHVALPHTRPEMGAFKVAIGISVLKDPVAFLDSKNNPVKYLFTLSATDNQLHLGAMSELVVLLEDSYFYEVLDSAESSEEVYQYISTKW